MIRRSLLAFAFACLWASPAFAQNTPTKGSDCFNVAAATNTTSCVLTSVGANSAVVVVILQTASAARSFQASDDGGNTYAVVTGAAGSLCGVSVCATAWADYSVSSSASLTVTVSTVSGTTNFAMYAREVNCPNGCAADTASNLTSGSGTTTHNASADGTVIDTATDVYVVSGCTILNGHDTLTIKTDWTEFPEAAPTNLSAVQDRTSAPALSNERGEIISSNGSSSRCTIVSVKDSVGGGGGASGCGGMLIRGVGCEAIEW